jgi:8-oxo-dGTP pyrophosphatase MutT (NUDIX family)
VAFEDRFELAANKEVDASKQNRRHAFSRVTLPVVDELLRTGLDLIKRGEYFEAHESLEDAWRMADPAEKDFFQGLVHVAVAWHHAGRGNRPGCERQLAKAQRRLGPFAPVHRGVDVVRVLGSVGEAARIVEGGSLELPRPLVSSTTWDGTEVARDKPYGSMVVVWRAAPSGGREYLVLHRRHAGPLEYEGDWAWTPPSGARQPDEPVKDAARRELVEETGLDLAIVPTELGAQDWAVFAAEASVDAEIVLDDEHDRFLWVTVADAVRLCLPAPVGRSVAGVEDWLASTRPGA